MYRQSIQLHFLLLVSAVFISGCGVAQTINIPMGTSAGFSLRNDIARNIKRYQKIKYPKCKFQFTNSEVVGSKDKVVMEEWTVLSCNEVVTYKVNLFTNEYGQASYSLEEK